MTHNQTWIDRQNAELRIGSIVRNAEDGMFERFDNLHKHNIDDDTIISVLRSNGRPELALQYIEWSGAVDPDSDEDNTTMNPVVPDPGDAPSYANHPLSHFVAAGYKRRETGK